MANKTKQIVLILGIMNFLTSTSSSRPTLSKFFLDTLMLSILLTARKRCNLYLCDLYNKPSTQVIYFHGEQNKHFVAKSLQQHRE